MTKHNLIIIWCISFLAVSVIGAVINMLEGESALFQSIFIVAGVMIFLGCPIITIDLLLAKRKSYNEKTEYTEKELQFKNYELTRQQNELQRQHYEIAQSRVQLEQKAEELKKKNIEIIKRDKELETIKLQKSQITDDDIRVSKERHFCLVHKGQIQGYSYICPECGSFYCLNCVEAIKQIENECWSCGAPLDPSLPVSKLKEEKEDFENELGEKKKMDEAKEVKMKTTISSTENKLEKFCGNCGKKQKPGAKFCKDCGAAIF